MQKIEITISGGAVQYVEFPRGVKVVIRDYDVEGQDLEGPDIRKDQDGDYYQNMEFIHEEDQVLDNDDKKPLSDPAPNSRHFKLWISIEAIDENRGIYADLADLGFMEPISLGRFARLRDAWAFILGLPGCRADERDRRTLAKAAQLEKKVWERTARTEPPQ